MKEPPRTQLQYLSAHSQFYLIYFICAHIYFSPSCSGLFWIFLAHCSYFYHLDLLWPIAVKQMSSGVKPMPLVLYNSCHVRDMCRGGEKFLWNMKGKSIVLNYFLSEDSSRLIYQNCDSVTQVLSCPGQSSFLKSLDTMGFKCGWGWLSFSLSCLAAGVHWHSFWGPS